LDAASLTDLHRSYVLGSRENLHRFQARRQLRNRDAHRPIRPAMNNHFSALLFLHALVLPSGAPTTFLAMCLDEWPGDHVPMVKA
jgi:hypothetical protein